MGKYDKLLIRLLSGASDANIAFDALRPLRVDLVLMSVFAVITPSKLGVSDVE